ncbi:MAG: PQQ-dependent sugar dehydrogenase [Alphaproteobacteria bacterium]|nr:PQQ-dependent sugar dehydrogenase [Alphaproteobacteria bacterium]
MWKRINWKIMALISLLLFAVIISAIGIKLRDPAFAQRVTIKKYKIIESFFRKFELQLNLEKFDERIDVINDQEYHVEFYDLQSLFGQEFSFGKFYFDTHDNGKTLFISNSKGFFVHMPVKDIKNSKSYVTTIPSNFNDYRNVELNNNITGMAIDNDKLYVSNNTINSNGDCMRMQLLVADINFKTLNFKKLFQQEECNPAIRKGKPLDRVYTTFVVGGRVASYKDNKILLSTSMTVGDPQDDNGTFGKILAIDKTTGAHEVISKGHRNPQGLYYNAEENIIFQTEHGPQGGDEINVNLNPSGDEIENYGWPIASYGWPYGVDTETVISKYKKPHRDYGFIEPIKYFSPSIGISAIIEVGVQFNAVQDRQIFVAALSGSDPDPQSGGHGISHFILNKDYTVKQKQVFEFEGRIRDLIYLENINKIVAVREWDSSLIVISAK